MKMPVRLLLGLLVIVLCIASLSCHLNTFEDTINIPGQDTAPPPPLKHRPESEHRFQDHVRDSGHIQDHLDGILDKPLSEMTEEETQFYYFSLHDYDKNRKLDGIEIVSALSHVHHDEAEKQENAGKRELSDEKLISFVDDILDSEDLNNDGYVSYSEFVTAQRQATLPTQG